LSFTPDQNNLKIGEKRQLALQVKSDAPLGLAVITLRFDPKILKISGVSAGSLFANVKNAPTVTQSIDEHGMLLVSIAPASGSSITADGVLLNLDVEGVDAGDTALSFDLSNVHLVAGDGRTPTIQIELIADGEVVLPRPGEIATRDTAKLFSRITASRAGASSGFSLIELIITVSVLAILTLGVIPLVRFQLRQKEYQLRASCAKCEKPSISFIAKLWQGANAG
jgi:prepilin-type N-terminal cleavage/methylation domain-containing protein